MGCCFSSPRGRNPNTKPSAWEPMKKRSCTDIIPLVIFVAFFLGMAFIATFSIINGSAEKLINGFDSYGNICNKNNKKIVDSKYAGMDLRGRPYVFFFGADPDSSVEICVKHCPNRTLVSGQEIQKFFKETGSMLCLYDVPPNDYAKASTANTKIGPCPTLPVVASKDMMFRCIPDSASAFVAQIVAYFNDQPFISKMLQDVYTSRYAILGLCFLAVLVSFIIVLLIRYVASIVVYVIAVLLTLGSLAGTALLWWNYAEAKGLINEAALAPPEIEILDSEKISADTFFWYAICATVFTVILLLLLLVMRKRVAITVELFYEAGKCMVHMPCLLTQPLWTFIILILFWMCWLIIFAFLATSLEQPQLENPFYGWVSYNATNVKIVKVMWWYHIVGLIWISEFILACQQMTVAGAVAKYYFTRNKVDLGTPILSSISTLIGNHIGSCAFGSFIITLIKIPRCILMYISYQIRDSENVIAKILVKCCICCLCVLERCLKYINYNAYSLVAINGTNFCKSACDAVSTLLSNALRVIAINSVGTFVLFLGKLMVVAITAGVAAVVVMQFHPNLHYKAAPIGAVALFSYLIAHCFLSVYEMAVDTLLLCFCEDCRVNDGSPGKEYFMSKSLMAYVRKSSKHLDTIDGRKEKKKKEEEENLHDESPV